MLEFLSISPDARVSKCNAWATKVCGDTRRNYLDSIKNDKLLSMAVVEMLEMPR
jgi:hypothetical protein